MRLTVPNTLSLSRLPIGLAVALASTQHAWGWAFGLYLVGCMTDLADGYVAARWHCGSDFGANVLEPVCDLALTVGALGGLILAHQIGVELIAILGLVALVVQLINSFLAATVWFRRFGQWFMPCYFLAVTWLSLDWFASLALRGGWLIIWAAVIMPAATCYLVWVKRRRFAAWFSGLIG